MHRDTHLSLPTDWRCFTPQIEALVVYLKLRIVSITLSKVPDVLLDVLDVAGGGGDDLPSVGISPAKIEVDSTHMSTTAIANVFMGLF
jgi:hypothetical protein